MRAARLLVALAAGMAAAGAAPTPSGPFRVATLAAQSAPCAAVGPEASPAEAAYFKHMSRRLELQVLKCPVASRAEAASALAAGKVDMAALDGPAYASARQAVRAMLTARRPGQLTRVPVVLAVRASTDPAALKGRSVILAGKGLAAVDLPRTVLAEQGLGEGYFGSQLIALDEEGAMEMLRSGRGDALAMQVGAWQRQCRGDSPSDDKCADLRIVWRARPSAAMAWAVRRDMEPSLRYRLIGVHIALHLENPEAFSWAAAQLDPGAENLEAAEAQALTLARLP